MKIKDAEIIALMSDPKTQEKGLRIMMDTYQSRLYWHIRRLIPDHDNAQDVLQETFIKTYQNFEKFKNDSQLYTWLYRIATNEALQSLNKAKRMQKTDEDADYHLQNMKADNEEKTSDEIQLLLQKAIDTLPEKQKIVFSLRYYEDLPYEEIAKILDTSLGNCKTSYHYAKEKIEAFIKQNYEQ